VLRIIILSVFKRRKYGKLSTHHSMVSGSNSVLLVCVKIHRNIVL